MGRKIFITGAGSGLGEGTAIGLARNGYDVIATAQTWPQVTALRLKSKAFALPTVRVEKLDLLDPYDVARACKWDFNILVNNAGIGEGGPIAEIPLDLVRRNFEVNVFAPLSNPACRKKLGCGRDPREDRLRIVNGRPLQSAGLLRLCRNQTCPRGDCGGDCEGDAGGAEALRHPGADDQSGRLSYGLQRSDGRERDGQKQLLGAIGADEAQIQQTRLLMSLQLASRFPGRS